MRRTDLVARYGGEEFVVLMPGTNADAALMRIEVLRQEIADSPIELGSGEPLRLSFSAGVAGTSEDREPVTPKALLTRADRRLLTAKRAGRGRCVGPVAVEVPGPG
jgi:diguanylate cyclase (GGDEF)-like protein